MNDAVLFELDDGLARITLNRPETLNAIDFEIVEGLAAALATCESEAARCVLLTGSGRAFCAGGNLRFFASADDLPALFLDLIVRFHDAVLAIARLDAPVVVAVQGSAAGAGFSLACGADLVVAASSARFVVGYSAIGLTPDGGGSYFLPRLAGLGKALDIALLNPTLDAAEAAAAGIVSRVVPDEQLDQAALDLARGLAAGPTRALGATKRLLRASLDARIEEQLERERQSIAAMARTDDGAEGLSAFVEKRPPHFTGR